MWSLKNVYALSVLKLVITVPTNCKVILDVDVVAHCVDVVSHSVDVVAHGVDVVAHW